MDGPGEKFLAGSGLAEDQHGGVACRRALGLADRIQGGFAVADDATHAVLAGDDPAEFLNLADDLAYQGVMLECAQKMLSWRMTHDERRLTNIKLTSSGPVERNGPRR